MRDKKVTFLTQAAMIAAIYVVLTFVFAPISFGEVQIRISEMLTVLPVFTPAAIPGLFVGCLIGNSTGGGLLPDVIFGSLATLIGAVGTYYLRNSNRLFAVLPPNCGEYLHCTLCAPLCLRRGATDSLPDADGRYRRSGFLRYPGKLSDLCSGQIQDQDL